ncbi:MAG: exodeoxyribonuclease VII large subunit [Desulfobacterales bacterium]
MTPPGEDPFSPEISPEPPPENQRRSILSVSELTRRIRQILEEKFPFVWITGEISNFRRPSSGHCYFTLKDDAAQIAAVLFRQQGRHLRFELEDGLSIIGLGRVSVYEPRGSYQIILEYVEPAGLGALQMAFEQLKKKLAAEGLFDPGRKRPIPFLPAKIAIITSLTGAVIHDILNITARRYPGVPIQILPVRVQGDEAAREIAQAIEIANARGEAEIILLARGGGSLEDLWPFNTETVARAIASSRIPVVSAVGHETDYTIADFVADLRAPTPSAAAELLVPDRIELLQKLQVLQLRLRRGLLQMLERHRRTILDFRRLLAWPRRRTQQSWMRLDELTQRLQRAAQQPIRLKRLRLFSLQQRLTLQHPQRIIKEYKNKVKDVSSNLLLFNKIYINKKSDGLRLLVTMLHAANPLAILRRGYSVTRSLPERRVISDATQVAPRERVEVVLSSGNLVCEIQEVHHGQKIV